MSDEKIKKLLSTIARATAKIDDLLVGKKATILSDYNGQPYGSSRPSMQGKEIVIADIVVEHGHVEVRPCFKNLYLPLDEVEVHW